jgi:hypothetical protein
MRGAVTVTTSTQHTLSGSPRRFVDDFYESFARQMRLRLDTNASVSRAACKSAFSFFTTIGANALGGPANSNLGRKTTAFYSQNAGDYI